MNESSKGTAQTRAAGGTALAIESQGTTGLEIRLASIPVKRPPASYEEFLREFLPLFDQRLAASETALYERPLTAAIFIVDHIIVAVDGHPIDDKYFSKPWFGGIFQPIYKWYERRYGMAITKRPHTSLHGVISHFGTPYLIKVPLSRTEPDTDGTAWVRFPCEILPKEDPLEWLETPPPLDQLSSKRTQLLRAAIGKVATCLRTINHDLNTAEHLDQKRAAMARSIVRHFDKAATDSVAGDRESTCLAACELQMACEKTLKAYLAQRRVLYPLTHSLRKLHKLAMDGTDWSEATKAITALPSTRRVMAWRYAETPPPKPRELERIYASSLQLCRTYAARMSRKLVLKNFAAQIRRPPWHPSVCQ